VDGSSAGWAQLCMRHQVICSTFQAASENREVSVNEIRGLSSRMMNLCNVPVCDLVRECMRHVCGDTGNSSEDFQTMTSFRTALIVLHLFIDHACCLFLRAARRVGVLCLWCNGSAEAHQSSTLFSALRNTTPKPVLSQGFKKPLINQIHTASGR
jgi:hypothetical protein